MPRFQLAMALLMLTRRVVLGVFLTAAAGVPPGFAQGLRDVSPEEAARALQNDPSIVALDIRTSREFAAGHIPNAINIDFYARDFAEQIMALDPTKTYVMYCQTGRRSLALMRAFTGSAFKDVMHVPEGFSGWRRKRLPIAR